MSVCNNYRDLVVWQYSRHLVNIVYSLTSKFPGNENFGLISQLRRAAISISSNIAEGWNRHSRKECIHFLKMAKGSAGETEAQLLHSMDLKYITRLEAAKVLRLNRRIQKMLGALIIKMEKMTRK